ncbi:DUF554 domain-containing protein [Sporosarcina sp. BI001-red]|uniref:DUF554 domain-containing protein n=1 Tax=Sporosarcina sp. BI001-red TaxID=2282866 RepID=UPI000E27997F|nr:DUF554 domain-containing protein [Sporosarcina sp. BI001-red]REB08152.1 DUF554 domain-containing protein [Sporosarcina sp. BI001-red]
MVFYGTLVNVALIVAGSLIGRVFKNIPDRMKQTVMYGIALAVMAIGIQMTFESTQLLIVIISIVIGSVIGEWINVDKMMEQAGKWLESKMPAQKSGQGISQGFITATMIFVIGSMSIIGAIDSGLRNDHDVLMMKGVIDGFTSIILSSTLGIGVIFAAVPVLLYQGLITLFSTQISRFVPDELLELFISEMTATGGLMILAIGLNLIGLTKIRVANFIPAIPVVALIVSIIYAF